MTDALAAGSIAFTGFNADGDDGLAFVSFSDIKAGTVIHFTDNAWNGTSFATDENVWSWTATSDVAAGTIISMSGLGAGGSASSNVGTVAFDTANTRDIADINEVVYAYTGDASAPVFLTAITNSVFNTSLGRGTLNGTGLTNGVNAKQMSTSPDIAVYVGLEYADLIVVAQPAGQPEQCRGLARSRRRHHIYIIDILILRLPAQSVRVSVIVCQDALLEIDYSQFTQLHVLYISSLSFAHKYGIIP